MKIALIGTAYPFRGGLATFNERLARALIAEGHEVTIYTFTLQYPDFLFPGKSQYSDDPAPADLNIIPCINSVNPINWVRVGQRIKDAKPDLVLIKYWLPFMGPCFGTILRQIKKNGHSKVINIIDNIIPHEKRPGDVAFTNFFVKPVDAFMAMSKAVLKDVDQFDTSKPRLFTPHPLYDNFGNREDREAALGRLGLDPQFRYLLFFGLIRDYKGLDLLIEAFADPRIDKSKYRLIIAGEYYADAAKYQNMITELGLDNYTIQANKFIPNDEVAHYFNGADLIVQPYKHATQSGVTQIAYHFEKPMVVTDVGGLAEICPDGKVGFVVDPQVSAITEGILKFIELEQPNQFLKGIRSEKEQYSWPHFTTKIYDLYHG